MPIESGKDVLLALLLMEGGSGRKGEEVVGLTRMEKLTFLLGKETALSERMKSMYDFKPCSYGPFDEKIQDNLEALKDMGIVRAEAKSSKYSWDDVADEYVDGELNEKLVLVYSLTDAGLKIAERIVEDEDSSVLSEIRKIKGTHNAKSVQRILKYVYTKYRDMAAKSLVREDVLGSTT